MTLAELGSFIAIVTGIFAGVGVARENDLGWPTIFFALGGFVVGLAVALPALKLSHVVLHRSITPAGERATFASIAYGFAYFIMPVVSMLAAGAATVFLSVVVLRLTQ